MAQWRNLHLRGGCATGKFDVQLQILADPQIDVLHLIGRESRGRDRHLISRVPESTPGRRKSPARSM